MHDDANIMHTHSILENGSKKKIVVILDGFMIGLNQMAIFHHFPVCIWFILDFRLPLKNPVARNLPRSCDGMMQPECSQLVTSYGYGAHRWPKKGWFSKASFENRWCAKYALKALYMWNLQGEFRTWIFNPEVPGLREIGFSLGLQQSQTARSWREGFMFDFRLNIYFQLCSYYIMFNIVTLRLGSCLDCGLGRWVKVCQGRKVGSCFRDGPSSCWTWHFQGLSCWVAGAPFLWRMAWPCYVIHSP